jgi:transcriptional regulator with XRE-family HTH domain
VSAFGEPPQRARQLGRRLRELRQAAGLTGAQLAERLGSSQSAVSRYELGQMIPPADVVDQWAEAVGATAEEHAELVDLAELAETETVVWRRRTRRGGLAERQQETLEMEASAGVVSNFHPVLMYRLLQVPGYARAVYEAFHVGARPDEAEGVAARLGHQEILHREERPRFEFLVSEAGLRWRFVPRDVMVAQFERLIEVSKLSNLYLGVVPLEMPAPVWHSHGFTIFAERAGGAETVVHIENLTGGDNLRNPLDVARYQDAFERLRKVALTGDEARSLLQRLAVDL